MSVARLPFRNEKGKWQNVKDAEEEARDKISFEGYENLSDLEASDPDGANEEEEQTYADSQQDNSDLEEASSGQNHAQNSQSTSDDYLKVFESGSIDVKRLYIGKLCSEVIEDGHDAAAAFPKLGKLLKCLKLSLHHPQSKEWLEATTLLMVGLLAVFQDVAPSYTIRPLTEAEKAEKVSKEVRVQREYEASLLRYYKSYISMLFSLLTKPRGKASKPRRASSQAADIQDKTPFAVYLVAYKCVFELLCSPLNSFNFWDDILSLAIFVTFQDKRHQVAEMGQKYLEKIFQQVDTSGRLTCQVLKECSEVIATADYKKMPFCILASFLAIPPCHLLPLQAARRLPSKRKHREEACNKKTAFVHVSRRNKKALKDEKQWRKELQESEASVQTGLLQKWHHETLQYLFRIYVGFLKKSPPHLYTQPAFEACLRGLTLFAPYIQGAFLDDLLLTLKQLAACRPEMGLSRKLLCLDTQFSLSLKISGLSLDLSPLYKIFYNCLAEFLALLGGSFGTHPAVLSSAIPQRKKQKSCKSIIDTWHVPTSYTCSDDDLVDLSFKQILESFDCMFLRLSISLHSMPLPRLAAFLHRLVYISLHLKQPSPLLSLLETCFKKFPKACFLLSTALDCEGDDDFFAPAGLFDPQLADPDLANATAFPLGALIELLAYNHTDGSVQEMAKNLLKLHA
jgi:hypothetical protein